ncbi:helix-turn-helix domain-containing protein [Streptomyces sp. NPDC094468]|uniref:helix-turn-helix domain-containing protein n=1 Tax=Streptomyces sp. NPDC094468 TaxID=3366066 RepID=UPI00381F5123
MPRDDLDPPTPERRELDKRIATGRRTLGERIADLRAPLGIRQDRLAELTGISRRTIQRIESGEGDPRYSELIRIAAALDEDVAVLISGSAQGPARPPRE